MDVANVFFENMRGKSGLNLNECEFDIKCKTDIRNYSQFIVWFNYRLVSHPIQKAICDLFKKDDDIYLSTYLLDFGIKFPEGTTLKTKISDINPLSDRPFHIAPFPWMSLRHLVQSIRLNPQNYNHSSIIDHLKVQ